MRSLLPAHEHLRSVLEVHGIVVIPLASPNEAVLFERPNDLPSLMI
jgi:hypothetical protein